MCWAFCFVQPPLRTLAYAADIGRANPCQNVEKTARKKKCAWLMSIANLARMIAHAIMSQTSLTGPTTMLMKKYLVTVLLVVVANSAQSTDANAPQPPRRKSCPRG